MAKIRLSFKDPDGVYDSCEDFAKANPEYDMDDAFEMISSFVKWSEYILVEIDTDTNTAKVIPQEDW